jgi:gamma-glutamylcyclotransferase (GGCT)/AIG2-like uncharacterized protein YtfP
MRFFFYGTLVAGHSNPVARMIHERLTALGPATTKGLLYGVGKAEGWYPVLLPGDGIVHGALYAASDAFDARDLARMDDYEDYDPSRPAASLYVRERVEIATPDGAVGPAQAYRFNQPLPPGARAIPGGDFAAWLLEHGLPAFASARH